MEKNDQEFLVQKIRTQYTKKEHTEMDTLKELDKRVKRPANVFAYIYGSMSAMIMGSGMSLITTRIGARLGVESSMTPGITIGLIGLIMVIATYPLYKMVLSSRKKKYAGRILSLSEKIMNR